MKILIIDHENLTVVGVKKTIQDLYKKVEFLTSTDKEEILQYAQKHVIDLVIINTSLTLIDSQQTISQLKSLQENVKVLILSDPEAKRYAMNYITAGASGFFDKTSKAEDLILALKLILSGQLYLSKDILLSNYSIQGDSEANVLPINQLSQRELEVFKLITKGKRIKDISEIMDIHQSTASTLKSRILKKFNVDNLMKLKSIALEYGY